MKILNCDIYPRLREASPGGIKEMAAIALPMIVAQGCDTIVRFTDRLFLSRIGPDTMNAAMAGDLTSHSIMAFFLGLTGYVTALVAHCVGGEQKNCCAIALTQAVMIILIAYPLILTCRPVMHSIFDSIGIPKTQLSPQKVYFDILLITIFFTLMRNIFNGFFAGIGKTGVVMRSAVIAMMINIAADYILIFGKFGLPKFGIRGAGYASIIAGASGLAILLGKYISKPIREEFQILRAFQFHRQIMRALLKFGSPIGLSLFLENLSVYLSLMVFHTAGVVAATAATIMFNWDMVSFVPLLGLEIGVTSLVGRYMGAGKPEIANHSTAAGIKVGVIYSLIIMLFFLAFPKMLVDLSHGNVNGVFNVAEPIVINMLRVASLYVLVQVMYVVYIGALNGAGDTKWAAFLSVVSDWLPIPILYFMMHKLNSSTEAVWTVYVLLFLVTSMFVYLRYKSGKWKKIKIIDRSALNLEEVTDNLWKPCR